MEKAQHPSNNKVLGAPKGWDQTTTECGALPVTVTSVAGHTAIKSYWRPSKEELAALNSGALVTLYVVSAVHPPIAVEVER